MTAMDGPMRISLCSLSELKEKGSITRVIEEWKDELSAFWADDKITVYSSVCPHWGGPVGCDRRRGGLFCPWHDWRFGADTGACTNRDVKLSLRRYPFAVKDGVLEVSRP